MSSEFAIKAKRIKNIYYFVIVLMVAQQLYAPVTYKYFHLPLMFLTLITADLFNFDVRDYANEYKILSLLGSSTLVALVDNYMVLDLKIVYYALMMVSMFFVYKLMMETIRVFGLGKDGKKYINERNIKLYKSNGLFMRIYGTIIIAVMMITAVYMALDILKVSF